MVLIGALLLGMLISSVLVVSACMLASQRSRELESGDGFTTEMSGHWSGTTFGGKYTTKVPHCSFEPEDLEDVQVVHHY